ncbi:MAG: SDR family oxidoreductase [Ignavibacteriae bacterium]|nr:SDR family oxidoreductase [Ignavibacteriota bacterium]
MEKAIWVTGASSGIGKAIVENFSKNNLTVIGTARRVELIKKDTDGLEENQKIIPIKNDVSDFEDVKKTVNEIQSKFEIDCLINNAGISAFKSFTDTSLEEIQNIIDVNLLGSIYATKAVLPEMIKRKSGTIINILSVAAKTVFTNSSIYTASKSGLEAFAKVLREEVREYNIRVINIFPGTTATEIWPQDILTKFEDKMMDSSKLADLILKIYTSDPSLSPEEIVVRPISGDL